MSYILIISNLCYKQDFLSLYETSTILGLDVSVSRRSRDVPTLRLGLVSRKIVNVSVSAIYFSCPRPIFSQIVQATLTKRVNFGRHGNASLSQPHQLVRSALIHVEWQTIQCSEAPRARSHTVPASSAASERVFSRAGLIMRPTHSRLSKANLSKLYSWMTSYSCSLVPMIYQ